ncbi:MAG: AMP-binding protein [Planctomycetia bacterium]|nr:AMP-binding protein [Planctomycetia bacterium]
MPTRDLFHPDQYRSFANLAEAFFFNANAARDLPAYEQAQADPENPNLPRRYIATLNSQSRERVLKLAAHLERVGVRPGDIVTIISLDRPEWAEAEMAVYTVGGVVVPAYVRDPLDRLHQILCDSGVTFALTENQEQLDKLWQLSLNAGGGLPQLNLRAIVAFEEVHLPNEWRPTAPPLSLLRDVLATEKVRAEKSFAWNTLTRDTLACVYYTSGSTGRPKGVPVTHGQALENLRQIAASRLVDYTAYAAAGWQGVQPSVTSFLIERAHVYPSRTGQLVATSPALARYPAVVDRRHSRITPEFRDSLRRDLRENAGQLVLVVPETLMTMVRAIRQRLAVAGIPGRWARYVIENAAARILDEAHGTSKWSTRLLSALLAPLRRRLAKRVRRQIVGPEFEFFVSGGAKLPLETAAFLGALDLPVYEGYGSTETNCPVAVNTPLVHRLGSVGKLFVGVETRLDSETGELLVRGPNVVHEYWHLPEETAATWSADGWCHTHDSGHVDADGFLYVDDRLDNMLVLLNGENVSATQIAGRFAAIPWIEAVVVVGHRRPALVALVALNEQVVRRWAADTGHELAEDWRNDPRVVELLRADVEQQVNAPAQHGFERIRHIGIIESLSPDERTLTATEKVRRNEVGRRYAALIERLYAEHSAEPRRRWPLVLEMHRAAAL